MHGACVFENKEQYDKASKILTVVLRNALEKQHLTREQYDAFDAFQLKVAEKECYLAYHVRKHIPLTFDAMMTSPVESITVISNMYQRPMGRIMQVVHCN